MAKLPKPDMDALLSILRSVDPISNADEVAADVRYVRIKDLLSPKGKAGGVKSPKRRPTETSSQLWQRLASSEREEVPGSTGMAQALGGSPYLMGGRELRRIERGGAGINLSPEKQAIVDAGGKVRVTMQERALQQDDELAKSISEVGVLEPIEINNGWIVDGNRRIAMLLKEAGPNAVIPVRASTRHFNPRVMLAQGIGAETPDDVLVASYLSSGLVPGTKEEIEQMVKQNGYRKLRQWLDTNDPFWLEFKETWGKTGRAPAGTRSLYQRTKKDVRLADKASAKQRAARMRQKKRDVKRDAEAEERRIDAFWESENLPSRMAEPDEVDLEIEDLLEELKADYEEGLL